MDEVRWCTFLMNHVLADFVFQGNQRGPMSFGLDDLRNRVDDELEHFNKTFSAAQKEETPQNLESLADAADQLMRAIGGVMIEAKRNLGD